MLTQSMREDKPVLPSSRHIEVYITKGVETARLATHNTLSEKSNNKQ